MHSLTVKSMWPCLLGKCTILSVCNSNTIKAIGQFVLLYWACGSLYSRSSLSLWCGCGCTVGGKLGGVSLLSCHYLQGWVSEGHNDCSAVWVLKRSNHAEVIGLTSIWCVCVSECVLSLQVFVYVLAKESVCAPVSVWLYIRVCVRGFISQSAS